MTQDSSYELRVLRRISWSVIILALLSSGLVLSEYRAVWFLSARTLVWVGLSSGILAGLTAVAGAIYCRRKKIEFPLVTIGALVAGVITLGWAATVIYVYLDMFADCHNSPLLGFGIC